VILAASGAASWLGVLIPLVIVFGIFVVGPLTGRHRRPPWEMFMHDKDEIAETQKQILAELEAVRARLDEIERVLTTVD
jgi:hypothetical protein